MFRLEMLPAAHGDCLWMEYGRGADVHRILIDGGPAHTYPALRQRILHLPEGEREFALLIVTHIDADHIEGVVRLLQDAEALKLRFHRIWFNGWDQLNRVPDPAGLPLGAVQGEYLSFLIRDYQTGIGSTVWNTDFADGVVTTGSGESPLPRIGLEGACALTLLSPGHGQLLQLKDRWEDELRKAGVERGDEIQLRHRLEQSRQLRPLGDVLGESDEPMDGRYELPVADGRDVQDALDDELGGGTGEPGAAAPFASDGSLANGSSIAVLLEYPADRPEVRFLLAGDAWAPVLEAAVRRVVEPAGGRLRLNGFKIPHHGSVANLSDSLLGCLECRHYLISTSGARFRHPHNRAVELLLDAHHGRARPRLHFNYLTETTRAWSDPADQQSRRYDAFHPSGIALEL